MTKIDVGLTAPIGVVETMQHVVGGPLRVNRAGRARLASGHLVSHNAHSCAHRGNHDRLQRGCIRRQGFLRASAAGERRGA